MFFPDDLLSEIFSALPVKSILRFRCVNKSCNSFISNPTFVKLHLKISAKRNDFFTLITHHVKSILRESHYGFDIESEVDYSLVPYSIRRLIDKPSFVLYDDPYYHLDNKECSLIIGSCNGLILLAGNSYIDKYRESWFRLWNPATRTISQKLGYVRDYNHSTSPHFCYAFGCDKISTYKVVAFRYFHSLLTTEVKVLHLGDDVWRNIESFPIIPLDLNHGDLFDNWVYFNNTLNWLAMNNNALTYNYKDVTLDQFVIVSLDLGTETYNRYLPPPDFDEVPLKQPIVGVLGGCLCFSYCHKETDFVIWQMKKFGIEDSWTQFLKISYLNLQIDYDINDIVMKSSLQLTPLLLSKDGDTLVIKSSQEVHAILYNWRDNRVERTKIFPIRTITVQHTSDSLCWGSAQNYVESLVPTFS